VKCKVICLRTRGRRLPWSEARNGPWHVGDMVSRHVNVKGQSQNVLTLRPADPMVGSPIADLYEPVLTRRHGGRSAKLGAWCRRQRIAADVELRKAPLGFPFVILCAESKLGPRRMRAT
jgi:hypothetical protein